MQRYDASPIGTSMKVWISKVGGLPLFARAIAHALMRTQGMSESQAIQTAIGVIRDWAAGVPNVYGHGKPSAKTQEKAAAALAEWEQKKAESHAMHPRSAERIARLLELRG
jgi:hypothetical protein